MASTNHSVISLHSWKAMQRKYANDLAQSSLCDINLPDSLPLLYFPFSNPMNASQVDPACSCKHICLLADINRNLHLDRSSNIN